MISRIYNRRAMPIDSSAAKAAEKAYMARAGSEHWERTKPFAPAGHDMLAEGLPLIHDFAVAVGCLMPKPGERVLDLGAGPCWVSEWLQRFNIDTVSVDIAHDMLRVGRARLANPSKVVAGDFEQLPFLDRSFDYATCLNAFHHVPDMPKALSEIHRVLRPGGSVVFSEPGRGHADAPASAHAVDGFGVTEQAVLVEPFLLNCRAAGFRSAHLKPLSYAVPHYDMDAARWRALSELAASKRPLRALRKMWLAALEMFGVGKTGPLAEDAFMRDLARLLHDAVADHPVVVATR